MKKTYSYYESRVDICFCPPEPSHCINVSFCYILNQVVDAHLRSERRGPNLTKPSLPTEPYRCVFISQLKRKTLVLTRFTQNNEIKHFIVIGCLRVASLERRDAQPESKQADKHASTQASRHFLFGMWPERRGPNRTKLSLPTGTYSFFFDLRTKTHNIGFNNIHTKTQ